MRHPRRFCNRFQNENASTKLSFIRNGRTLLCVITIEPVSSSAACAMGFEGAEDYFDSRFFAIWHSYRMLSRSARLKGRSHGGRITMDILLTEDGSSAQALSWEW